MEQQDNVFADRDPDDQVDTAERRQSERRPPLVEPTFVWVSVDRRIRGRLIDESDEGIGVLVSDVELIEVGFQVRVELGDARKTASVVYIRELAPNLYRLGLTWE